MSKRNIVEISFYGFKTYRGVQDDNGGFISPLRDINPEVFRKVEVTQTVDSYQSQSLISLADGFFQGNIEPPRRIAREQ